MVLRAIFAAALLVGLLLQDVRADMQCGFWNGHLRGVGNEQVTEQKACKDFLQVIRNRGVPNVRCGNHNGWHTNADNGNHINAAIAAIKKIIADGSSAYSSLDFYNPTRDDDFGLKCSANSALPLLNQWLAASPDGEQCTDDAGCWQSGCVSGVCGGPTTTATTATTATKCPVERSSVSCVNGHNGDHADNMIDGNADTHWTSAYIMDSYQCDLTLDKTEQLTWVRLEYHGGDVPALINNNVQSRTCKAWNMSVSTDGATFTTPDGWEFAARTDLRTYDEVRTDTPVAARIVRFACSEINSVDVKVKEWTAGTDCAGKTSTSITTTSSTTSTSTTLTSTPTSTPTPTAVAIKWRSGDADVKEKIIPATLKDDDASGVGADTLFPDKNLPNATLDFYVSPASNVAEVETILSWNPDIITSGNTDFTHGSWKDPTSAHCCAFWGKHEYDNEITTRPPEFAAKNRGVLSFTAPISGNYKVDSFGGRRDSDEEGGVVNNYLEVELYVKGHTLQYAQKDVLASTKLPLYDNGDFKFQGFLSEGDKIYVAVSPGPSGHAYEIGSIRFQVTAEIIFTTTSTTVSTSTFTTTAATNPTATSSTSATTATSNSGSGSGAASQISSFTTAITSTTGTVGSAESNRQPEAKPAPPLAMIVVVVIGVLVLIVLLVFVYKKCSDRSNLARLEKLGGMHNTTIANQAYAPHNSLANGVDSTGNGFVDDNNTYDMAPPGQRSATLNNGSTSSTNGLADDNNTYDMAPPGQRSATANRKPNAAGRSDTLTVTLTPNVMYGGSADVKPRNATLLLNRAAAPPSSASQEQYAVIADGSSGPPKGAVVYNAGDGGGGGDGPLYATPTTASAGASGGNQQYDGWTVNETYAATDATTSNAPIYAVYAGSISGGGAGAGAGGVYATVNNDRHGNEGGANAKSAGMIRPRSNSLYSLTGEAQRDRSGTLQLAAAQRGVVYNVPMEEDAPNPKPAQANPSKAVGRRAAVLIPYEDAGNGNDSEL